MSTPARARSRRRSLARDHDPQGQHGVAAGQLARLPRRGDPADQVHRVDIIHGLVPRPGAALPPRPTSPRGSAATRSRSRLWTTAPPGSTLWTVRKWPERVVFRRRGCSTGGLSAYRGRWFAQQGLEPGALAVPLDFTGRRESCAGHSGMRVTAGSAVLAAVVAATAATAVGRPAARPTPTTHVTRSAEPDAHPDPRPDPRRSPPDAHAHPRAASTPAPPQPNDPPRTPTPSDGDGEPDHHGGRLRRVPGGPDRRGRPHRRRADREQLRGRRRHPRDGRARRQVQRPAGVARSRPARPSGPRPTRPTRARADLVVLEGRLATARQILRDWVFSVYSGGGGDADIAGMLDAMSVDARGRRRPAGRPVLPHRAAHPGPAGRQGAHRRAGAAQRRRRRRRGRPRPRPPRSSSETRAALDKAVSAQRARVGELRTLQIAEVEKAGPVANILVGARTPAAKAAAQRLRDALSAAVGRRRGDRQAVHQRHRRLPQRDDPRRAGCARSGAPPVRASPPVPRPASTR